MPQGRLTIDRVVIPSPDPLDRDVARFDQVGDDPLSRALGDPDPLGDIPRPDVLVLRDAQEYLRVVRDERPRLPVRLT